MGDREIGEEEQRRSARFRETAAFLFLAVFLAPAFAVAGVGGYGLLIWLAQ